MDKTIKYVNSVVSPGEIFNKFQRIIPTVFNILVNALKVVENNHDKTVFISNDGNVAVIRPKILFIFRSSNFSSISSKE
jgi:hypothetical protein